MDRGCAASSRSGLLPCTYLPSRLLGNRPVGILASLVPGHALCWNFFDGWLAGWLAGLPSVGDGRPDETQVQCMYGSDCGMNQSQPASTCSRARRRPRGAPAETALEQMRTEPNRTEPHPTRVNHTTHERSIENLDASPLAASMQLRHRSAIVPLPPPTALPQTLPHARTHQQSQRGTKKVVGTRKKVATTHMNKTKNKT